MKWLLTILLLIASIEAWGWEEYNSHPSLTQIASDHYFYTVDPDFLDKYLTVGNESLTARNWLRRGSTLEDDGTKTGYVTGTARSLYHFHDPTKALGLGGLSDMPVPQKMSTPLWAQNKAAQAAATGGDWSWGTIRTHYYNYLTAANKTDSDANLARTLMGLGYQLHLIQDMSQPNHVRNDTHMDDGMANKPINGFETWARFHPDSVALILGSNDAQLIINSVAVDLTKEFINTVDGSKIAPVARLFDTRDTPGQLLLPSRSLSQGLAEYTNTNFFSEDTTFAAQLDLNDKHYYAYPSKGETTVQQFIDKNLPAIPFFDFDKTYLNFRISKPADQTMGEPLNCMAKPGPNTAKYYKLLGDGKFFYGSFMQDDECFFEQASKLLPRAVGYSKAMLDYFYRGKIEVQPVTTASTLQHFVVKLKNTTTTGEEMTGGEIALAIKYRIRAESTDHIISPPSDTSGYYYKIAKLSGQYSIPRDQQSEQVFDLGTDPLPLFATDVTLQVVYRGQLGNEAGAVAVGNVSFDKYTTDIALSLPASGIYSSIAPNATGFSRITLNANTLSDLVQPDGLFELVLKYRMSSSDPFQGVAIDTLPVDPASFYVLRANEANGVYTLQKGVSKELAFDLPTPLPLWASDVYINVIYKRAGSVEERPLAIGQIDISEPTPVDVFNNTDRVCINNQWYVSGSPEAYAAVGVDTYGDPLDDIFTHQLDNLSFWASGNGTLALPLEPTARNLSAATAEPGVVKRLGYVLTDYTFDYVFDEIVTPLDARDDWAMWYDNKIHSGTGFTNQSDRGFTGMYTIRGNKLWWGTSVIYDLNDDSDINCGWDNLPQ